MSRIYPPMSNKYIGCNNCSQQEKGMIISDRPTIFD